MSCPEASDMFAAASQRAQDRFKSWKKRYTPKRRGEMVKLLNRVSKACGQAGFSWGHLVECWVDNVLKSVDLPDPVRSVILGTLPAIRTIDSSLVDIWEKKESDVAMAFFLAEIERVKLQVLEQRKQEGQEVDELKCLQASVDRAKYEEQIRTLSYIPELSDIETAIYSIVEALLPLCGGEEGLIETIEQIVAERQTKREVVAGLKELNRKITGGVNLYGVPPMVSPEPRSSGISGSLKDFLAEQLNTSGPESPDSGTKESSDNSEDDAEASSDPLKDPPDRLFPWVK